MPLLTQLWLVENDASSNFDLASGSASPITPYGTAYMPKKGVSIVTKRRFVRKEEENGEEEEQKGEEEEKEEKEGKEKYKGKK